MLTQTCSTGVFSRIEKDEIQTQRLACKGQHPCQLTTAEYTDGFQHEFSWPVRSLTAGVSLL